MTALGGSKAVAGSIVGILGISALFFRLPIGILLIISSQAVAHYRVTDSFSRFRPVECAANTLDAVLFTFDPRNRQQHPSDKRCDDGGGFDPKEQLSVGLGYFSIAQQSLAQSGPLLGLAVVETYGFEALFRVALLLTSIAFLLSFFLSTESPRPLFFEEKPKTKSGATGALSVMKNRGVTFPSLIMFLICFANSGVIAFIAQFAIEKKISGAGYYFTVMTVVTVLIRFLFPQMLKRVNQTVLICGSILSISAAFGLLAFADDLAHLLLAAILYGIGFASLLPVMNTIVLQSISDQERGRAIAIFSAALDVAYGGGAMLWGVIASLFGFQVMYLFCGGFGITALFAYLLFDRKKKKMS